MRNLWRFVGELLCGWGIVVDDCLCIGLGDCEFVYILGERLRVGLVGWYGGWMFLVMDIIRSFGGFV